METGIRTQANLIVFAFCENIIQDLSNKFSLINLFDTISISDVPGQFFCNIFISVHLSTGEYSVALKSISPSGEETDMPLNTKLEKKSEGTHNVVIGLNISIKETGVYKFHLYVNELILSTRELIIVLQDKTSSKDQ